MARLTSASLISPSLLETATTPLLLSHLTWGSLILTQTLVIGTPIKRSAFSKQAEIEEVVYSMLVTTPLLTPAVGEETAPIICNSLPDGVSIFWPITKRIAVEPTSKPAMISSLINNL